MSVSMHGCRRLKGKHWMLSLPEDLDSPSLCPCLIPEDDERKGLRGSLGVRASAMICKGDIIGPYRAYVQSTPEYDRMKWRPPQGWREDGDRIGLEFAQKWVCSSPKFWHDFQSLNIFVECCIAVCAFGRSSSKYKSKHACCLLSLQRRHPRCSKLRI